MIPIQLQVLPPPLLTVHFDSKPVNPYHFLESLKRHGLAELELRIDARARTMMLRVRSTYDDLLIVGVGGDTVSAYASVAGRSVSVAHPSRLLVQSSNAWQPAVAIITWLADILSRAAVEFAGKPHVDPDLDVAAVLRSRPVRELVEVAAALRSAGKNVPRL